MRFLALSELPMALLFYIATSISMANLVSAQEFDTGCQLIGGKDLEYFDRHNVNCPPGTVLSRFRMVRDCSDWDYATIRYNCDVDNVASDAVETEGCGGTPKPSWLPDTEHDTGCQEVEGKSVAYLDRHNIECPEGSFLAGFQMNRNCGDSKYARIEYKCRRPENLPSNCAVRETDCNPTKETLPYFDRFDVSCPREHPLLGSWQMTREDCMGEYHRIKYSCCSSMTATPTKYDFMYEIRDYEIEPVDVNTLSTERLSTNVGGNIKNCASGTSFAQSIDMSLTVSNSQSITASKSFTSDYTRSITNGVELTSEVEIGSIFTKAKASVKLNFESSRTWGSSNTEEDSMTLENSTKISLGFSSTIDVNPQTCADYTLFTHVSSDPVMVPYKAKAYLKIFETDDGSRGKQIEDLDTLECIQNLLSDYEPIIDEPGNIVFEIDGIYQGMYVAEQEWESSNCNDCITAPNGAPTDSAGSESEGPTPSPQPKAEPASSLGEDKSGGGCDVYGIEMIWIYALVAALTLVQAL
mmetsp:Transcript_4728/g.8814  ORF Transcript_4728/g.8814 Transcript_4728/m.8814 type:complete len:525 (+) Transcript_4728:238-1812(+)